MLSDDSSRTLKGIQRFSSIFQCFFTDVFRAYCIIFLLFKSVSRSAFATYTMCIKRDSLEQSSFIMLVSNNTFSCFHRRNISLIRQLARIRLKPITRIITVFVVKRSDSKRQRIILITIVTILLFFVLFGYTSIFSLYLYGHPFCLDAFSVALLSLAQALTVFIASFLVIVCKKFLNESYVLPLLGSFALTIGLTLFSVAKKLWLLYIGNAIVVILY